MSASARSVFFSRLTLGGCGGTVVATGAILLAERVMPLDLAARGDWIARIFFVVLALCVAAAYGSVDKRRLLRIGLWASAGLTILTVGADWLMYGGQVTALWNQGYQAIIGVEIGLLAATMLFAWAAWLLRPKVQP